MRIVLLMNPKSGRGEAAHAVAGVVEALEDAGHRVQALEVGPLADTDAIAAAASAADAMIIAGGDGTVHHALPLLLRTRTPMYQFPLGTENLFSREFGMVRNPSAIVAAVERGRRRAVDVGFCNDRPFVLMCSAGFDACVVERVAAIRTSTIRRTDYVVQGLRELAFIRTPGLSIDADGRTLISARPGMVVIANSRRYAARFDPVRDAVIDDGVLDVMFLPHGSRAGLMRWVALMGLGLHHRAADLVRTRGRHVRITLPADAPHQLDGEHVGPGGDRKSGPNRVLDIRLEPRAITVIEPVPAP